MALGVICGRYFRTITHYNVNSSPLNVRIGGQVVDVTDSVTHLGHDISSRDRDRIVKSDNSSLWKSFNIFMSDFGKLSCLIKNKMFNQYYFFL